MANTDNNRDRLIADILRDFERGVTTRPWRPEPVGIIPPIHLSPWRYDYRQSYSNPTAYHSYVLGSRGPQTGLPDDKYRDEPEEPNVPDPTVK